MKKIAVIFLVLIVFGCARVSVQTPEPIKVDIKMRVDVYQHVVKEVESIEDQVYGPEEKNFNAIFGISKVYAAQCEGCMSAAIARRKERAAKVEEYLSKGYVGINKDAFLTIIKEPPSQIRKDIEAVVSNENSDRRIIYREMAEKNDVPLSEMKKVFFQANYKRASSGYWFQVYKDGRYKWIKK